MKNASLKRLKGSLAFVIAAFLAANAILGAQPARADDFPPGYPKVASQAESIAGARLAYKNSVLLPTLIAVHTDQGNRAIQAYCIELDVPIIFGSELNLGGWDTFPGNNKFKTDATVRAKVAWIIQRSFPETDLTEIAELAGVTGLTQEEAIAATQGAIWHFTNDFPYQGLGYHGSTVIDTTSDSAVRVKTLFEYLTSEANTGLNETSGPSVELTATTEMGEAGKKVGPLLIESTQASVEVEELAYPLVDAEGNLIDLKAVPTGTELYLDVPADAPAGQQELKVVLEGSAYSGQLLVAREKRSQTIIIGRNTPVTAQDAAMVSWTAVPETEVTLSTSEVTPSVSEATTSASTVPVAPKLSRPGLPKTGD